MTSIGDRTTASPHRRPAAGSVEVAKDYDSLCRLAADHFVQTVNTAVAERGQATVALAGGSTPRGLYRLLASEPYCGRIPWKNIHFFWGDERCVPPDHADSNYGMANQAMLGSVPVDCAKIHRLAGEDSDIAAAAARYQTEVRRYVPSGTDGVPRFDLVLLGMGKDGHTASLFPHTVALSEAGQLVVPNTAPDGSPRLTFTYPLLNATREVDFLISGADKTATLAQVWGEPQPDLLPSQGVHPSGVLRWLVDEDAYQTCPPELSSAT